jgi:hypothetical protein
MDISLFFVAGYKFEMSGAIDACNSSRTAVYYKESLKFEISKSESEVISLANRDLVLIGIYRQFKLKPGHTLVGD